jgi:transposase
VREVWSNELGDVVTGPAPVKVLDKGLPGLELLVQVVLAKFRDHVPLTRQTQIYQRLGVELSRNTLMDWVGGAAQLLLLPSRLDDALRVVSRRVVDREISKNHQPACAPGHRGWHEQGGRCRGG